MTEEQLQIADKKLRLFEFIVGHTQPGDDPLDFAKRAWAWIAESRDSPQEAIHQELADLGQEIHPEIYAAHQFGPPPTMRQLVMEHLGRVGRAGATANEMAAVFGVNNDKVSRRLGEYVGGGEIVRDSGHPARHWLLGHAPRHLMPQVPIQKQTALDGGPVSSAPTGGQMLTSEAIKVYNAIRRPGTDVQVTGPMDVPDVPLALAQRALSELSRLGYIAKENGVWTDLKA
jgi:hypothetical protein